METENKISCPAMSNCTQFETTKISRSILSQLWAYQCSNIMSFSTSQINTQVTICNRTHLIQHKAHTWNCTLGILMRIQIDEIQLKALYR